MGSGGDRDEAGGSTGGMCSPGAKCVSGVCTVVDVSDEVEESMKKESSG